MEDRAERVRAHVLDFIANDYEEIGQILIDLGQWNADLMVTRDEVKIALDELIRRGWARAYGIGPQGEAKLVEEPEISRFDDLYFYITPLGLKTIDTFPKEWFPPIE